MLCNVIQTLLSIRSSPFSPFFKWRNIIYYDLLFQKNKMQQMGRYGVPDADAQ